MSYLEKSRADRVALKQDGLLCFLLLLVASTILTICSLILAYRPDAFSVTIAPAVVGMILMTIAFTKFALEASLWRRRRYLLPAASIAGMVMASGFVIAIADRVAISKVADSLLLAL